MSVPTPSLPAAALPAASTTPAALFPMGAPQVMFLPDALQACVEAGTCWQQEIARFVERRLAENVRSWQAVTAARDVAGVVKAQ